MNAKPFEPTERRQADYNLLSIIEKFVPEADQEKINGTCANIRKQIEGDLFSDTAYENSFSASVSAPYVLARLCALFKGLHIDVGGQDYYKITWQVILTHKETGHVITFYDYKGGISYGSDIYGPKTPKTFLKDVKNLLEVLKNDRCPHPYAGCVVGEIA